MEEVNNSNVQIETEQTIDNTTSIFDSQFSNILNTLSQLKTQITSTTLQMKNLEKQVKKEMKNKNKEISKNKNRGNRKPSGFAEATQISDELCDFMGKEKGEKIARTEVTKYICTYIKDNDLKQEDNKRIINPDIKLKTLLGVTDNSEITFFNIQRYMNKHFIKSANKQKQELEK
jgi:chromatin remodeling complex protein RSC6